MLLRIDMKPQKPGHCVSGGRMGDREGDRRGLEGSREGADH